MNEKNQSIKLYHIYGHEKEYDTYHRLYKPCKVCASIRCSKYYQKNRSMILEKSRVYRENNKDKYKRNRKTIETNAEDIQNLYNQINILTEMIKTTAISTS